MRPAVLSMTEQGFELKRYELRGTVIQLKTCWSVDWADVVMVMAFKRDLFTYDLICLAMDLTDGTWVEVDEEMEGFKELQETLPRVLRGLDADWWGKVAFPAFATNATTIWRSDVQSASCNSSS